MKRQLYMAKNMEALNASVEIPKNVVNPRVLTQSALKMQKLANDGYVNHDEELAYVYFMRYLNLVNSIKKTSEFRANPKFYLDLLGPNNMTESLNKAEKLSKSLMDRYDERRAAEVAGKLASMSISSSSGEERTGHDNYDDDDDVKISNNSTDGGDGDSRNVAPQLPGGVVPLRLYQRLKSGEEKILIVDIRSEEEFAEARMKYPDSVVSIPAEAILPGYTLNRMEEALPPETRRKLNRRGDCDIVVIVDWNGSVAGLEDTGNPLKTVHDALWKYDARGTLKSEPIVLEGGFEDWFEYYPMLSTGKPSRLNQPSSFASTEADDIKLDFDYEYEEYDPSKYRNNNDKDTNGQTDHKSSSKMIPKPIYQMNDLDRFTADSPRLPPVFATWYNGFPKEEARIGDHHTSTSTTTLRPNIPSIDRSLKPKNVEGGNGTNAWNDDGYDRKISTRAGSGGAGGVLESPRLRHDLTSSSQESLNSAVSSSGDSDEATAAAVAAATAERDKELRQKDAELAEKEEQMRLLEETLETKSREMEAMSAKISAERITRQKEEEARERKRKEEEERRIETEHLRVERKEREALERRKLAEQEAALRAKEEEAKLKLSREREELENMRAATKADQRRVAAEKAAVEETKRKLEEAARKKPKPTSMTKQQQQQQQWQNGEVGVKRSGSPVITPQKQSTTHQVPPGNTTTTTSDPKPRPLVDRTAKPNSNNNARIVIDWNSRIDCLRPVGGGPGPGLTGLRNLGNTCYMNSIVQCLSNTAYLTRYFRQDVFVNDINLTSKLGSKGELAVEFANIIRNLWSGDFKHISPRTFKQTVGRINSLFVGNEQQDSSELLLFLLDGLHEDLNRIAWQDRPTIPEQNNDNLSDDRAAKLAWTNHVSLNDSIVVTLFQGQLKSTVMCLTCRKQSVTFDPFMYLSLPLPAVSRSCSINDCIQLFLKEEKMSGSSQWNCPRCKGPRDAVKKIDIWKLPRILLIHLKRFQHDGFRHRKITSGVDFPLNQLDMRPNVAGPVGSQVFELYAISNHYGTMEGGHYTAYSKNPRTQSWYKYDDHEVLNLSPSEVKSSAAYILFYAATDFTSNR